jgi:hypothetical protein
MSRTDAANLQLARPCGGPRTIDGFVQSQADALPAQAPTLPSAP